MILCQSEGNLHVTRGALTLKPPSHAARKKSDFERMFLCNFSTSPFANVTVTSEYFEVSYKLSTVSVFRSGRVWPAQIQPFEMCDVFVSHCATVFPGQDVVIDG